MSALGRIDIDDQVDILFEPMWRVARAAADANLCTESQPAAAMHACPECVGLRDACSAPRTIGARAHREGAAAGPVSGELQNVNVTSVGPIADAMEKLVMWSVGESKVMFPL